MLVRPRKRICPSLIWIARSKTRRQDMGLRNGTTPSATSNSAQALMATSQNPTFANAYFLGVEAGALAAVAGNGALPRMALKNSLFSSTTIRSLLLRNAPR